MSIEGYSEICGNYRILLESSLAKGYERAGEIVDAWGEGDLVRKFLANQGFESLKDFLSGLAKSDKKADRAYEVYFRYFARTI